MYDACVLYPAPLRDLLLELAASSLFRAKWSDEIHEEWITNVLANRGDLSREKLERTRALMNEAVLDCLVEGHMDLIESLTLPDPGDRHILAAAIHSGADAIVTFNLRDFLPLVANQYAIEVLHPDDFIRFQFDFDNAAVIVAAQRCRSRLRFPARSVDEYLETLAQQRLPKTVSALAPFRSII
ncbi:MAG: PIN domain-containing protein [Novosphingobium sp.]